MRREKKKILIVDDEEDILFYFESLFQDNGYDTIIAENGAEGFELAKSEKPDLITLDITMPGQSGIRTFCQYKSDPDLKDIPVVIITAADDSMRSFLKEHSKHSSPEDFLTKPVDTKELLNRINDILSR